MKVLVTCPPMLRRIEEFRADFESKGIELVCPPVVQTLTEEELIELLPTVDAWIIGDDPANAKVFAAGKKGKLRAAVKWGVGVDNVDFKAAESLGIPISNTPGMFGEEVSNVAIAYLLALTRFTHQIDRSVRKGIWLKPPGISLTGKKAALIGYGNIGQATATKLKVFGLDVFVYDPFAKSTDGFKFGSLEDTVKGADILIVTCALTKDNFHLVNDNLLSQLNPGASVINVSRGPLIDEDALVRALESGHINGAGLEVFEIEPIPSNHPFFKFENVIFGSHNGSNTIDAVRRTSRKAIDILFSYLKIK